MALLSVQNVCMLEDSSKRRWFRYSLPDRKLLDDVSFEIDRHQSLALVGEEGSGKFPLTLAILRLVDVSSGSIYYDKINTVHLNQRKFRTVRKWIQAVFPDSFGQFRPNVKLDQSFRESLRVWLPKAKEDEIHSRIEHVMIELDLPEAVRYMFPVELDPLERQAAALARAMLPDPEFLLCHNVTRGLDAVEQAEVLNRISELRERRSLTLMISTDDLLVAHHMSDRIAVLHSGKILETGDTEDVVDRPQHEYTKRLVSYSL